MEKMGDLKKRLGVSISLLLIVGLFIAFAYVEVVSIVVACGVAFLAAVALWEYARMAGAKGYTPPHRLMITAAICQVLAFFISLKYFNSPQLPLVVLALSGVAFFIVHFRDTSNAIVHVAFEFFGVCYIVLPLSCILAILYLFPYEPGLFDGRLWIVYLIVVTKITDIAAYFVGRLWGKQPFAPRLSPKKTLEGATAGFIAATLASVLSAMFGLVHLSLISAVWMGMVIGVLGQFGDLAESLLKRDAVVKDSNKIPGLGGVLDMVDSLLFTTPVVYFYLRAFA